MADNEIPSEENKSKGSGCSTLIMAGMSILGFIGVLQVLSAISDYFGDSTTLCCVVLIVIVIVVFIARGRRKEKTVEPEGLPEMDPWVLLEEGKRLLSQGKREAAIAAYLQAHREGSALVREQALAALEAFGEVETF